MSRKLISKKKQGASNVKIDSLTVSQRIPMPSQVSVPVNTESVEDIINFLNNNIIGEQERQVVLPGQVVPTIQEQKAALNQLVSPQPASRVSRVSRGDVPSIGYNNTIQAAAHNDEDELVAIENIQHNEEALVAIEENTPHNEEQALVDLEDFDLAKNAFIQQLGILMDNRLKSVEDMIEQIKEDGDVAKERAKLIAIYESLTAIKLSDTLEIEVLRERVKIQLNTYVTWLKTRMNNYILDYFTFATPKIQEILKILEYLPSTFFTDPDNIDMLGNSSTSLNFKQVSYFVCYIALLCILLMLYLVAGLMKFINDIDTMLGITLEIMSENQDIRELRHEYRKQACMTGLGLIEYTLRCINVNHILKFMFSRVGIIPTISIMCICIYVFRNQSLFFNKIYILFFQVLRIVVQTIPTSNSTAEVTKKTVIIFIDTQIYGVEKVAYDRSPQQIKDAIDTVNYVTNSTSSLIGEAKDFVNNTMILVPLLCANLTEQVVNANYTDVSINTARGTSDILTTTVEDITEQVSSVIKTSVIDTSNIVVNIAEGGLEKGLEALFVGMSVINDYSIYWASLVIEEEEDGSKLNSDEIIQRLKEEIDDTQEIIFQDEAGLWLSVFHETALVGDSLLHTSSLTKEHTSFISDRFSKIPNPILNNQITVNPRSLITRTDEQILLGELEYPQQNVIVDNSYPDVIRKGTLTENDFEEPPGQMVPYEKTAKSVLDKTIEFNSVILPLMKERYGKEIVNEDNSTSLERVSFEPPPNDKLKKMIHVAGGIVLKVIMPETTLEQLQRDIADARDAINNLYGESKVVLKTTILKINEASTYVLSLNKDKLKNELAQRAKDIKDANGELVSQTLIQYNGFIKVAVVVVAGTTILYVAPAGLGLAATILPPLYSTSVAGLQLVGSMGYYSASSVARGGYVMVNNVFYPTARAAVYMLSRLLGIFIGNTVRINPQTLTVTTTNEVTNFIFGNGAMWLPLDQSIGPIVETVYENSALVAQGASEIGEVLVPFVRHNINEFASVIAQKPNTIGAFSTLTVAATSSALVGQALNEAKNNPESNSNHLRKEPEILDTSAFMDPWYNSLTEPEKVQLDSEYNYYIRDLTPEEKQKLDFKEDYRQWLIEHKKKTEEEMARDRLTEKYVIMKKIQKEMNKQENRMMAAETITKSEEDAMKADETVFGRVSKSVSGLFGRGGGSKKKRKGSAKKSTRRHKKKSGKKGKSNKKKRSNKKRRHTRR
jgi:hypothetical protein